MDVSAPIFSHHHRLNADINIKRTRSASPLDRRFSLKDSNAIADENMSAELQIRMDSCTGRDIAFEL